MRLLIFKYFRNWPLKLKILVPILILCFICILSIIGVSRHFYYKRLTGHALVRCKELAHSIGACAQITHYTYELQRLIYAFSSEPHIRFIGILHKDPLSIVACNRRSLVGKKWTYLPDPRGIRLPKFPQEKEVYDIIQTRYVFNYAFAFYYLQYETNYVSNEVQPENYYTTAYVVVQMDTYYWSKEFLQQSISTFAISAIILISILMLTLYQVNTWILRPINNIKRQMNKRRLGNTNAMAPVFYKDEIGDLSNTLNDMILSQEKTENLFQNLINIAPVLIWTTNEDNSHFFFNQQWCSFTKQPQLTYSDWSWLKFLSPGIAQYYQSQFLKAQKLRQSLSFECLLKNSKGDNCWMLCQSVPRILSDGRFEGYISCLVDITERKKSEKRLTEYASELAKARDKAIETTQAKSTFLATVSHELRTPINGILGFSYLLQDTELNNEQKDYVKTIQSSTQILLDLINQVLDLSKIEAKKFTLEPINFSLDDCLNDICTLFRPALNQKQLNLNLWVHPNIEHWLKGDVKRLRQVLLNLIGNAIKFTEKGSISIRVSGRNCKDNKYQLFISVRDEGVGISKDDLKRIFETFEQVAYQNKGGTGLGLSISQSLVKLMGGELKVYSRLNKGSIFYFSVFIDKGIPQEIKDLPNFSYSKPLNENISNSKTILLVEDNIENQKVAQKILEKHQFNISVVANGIQCLQCLQRNTIDAIIMDINMPQMDGFETTQRIRSGECGLEKAALPIIGLTASALQETYDKAILVGMDDVLTKPLQPDILIQKIKEKTNS